MKCLRFFDKERKVLLYSFYIRKELIRRRSAMSLGSMRSLLLFMIFIMHYISRFLPRGTDEPEDEEMKAPDAQVTVSGWLLF